MLLLSAARSSPPRRFFSLSAPRRPGTTDERPGRPAVAVAGCRGRAPCGYVVRLGASRMGSVHACRGCSGGRMAGWGSWGSMGSRPLPKCHGALMAPSPSAPSSTAARLYGRCTAFCSVLAASRQSRLAGLIRPAPPPYLQTAHQRTCPQHAIFRHGHFHFQHDCIRDNTLSTRTAQSSGQRHRIAPFPYPTPDSRLDPTPSRVPEAFVSSL